MYPATQTTHASTAVVGVDAPSLADIVREQTQGGRLIIRFLVNAMSADTPSFKPCYRIDATAQLIKLRANDSPFAHIVHEMTDGGNLITQFLTQAINGQLPDFQDCHNMAAQRLLVKLYPEMDQVLAKDNTPSPSHDRRSREGGNPSLAPLPTGSAACDVPEHAPIHAAPSLDEIVRQETNDGRDIVRFYADVMHGVLTDFKTHQRMDAADKLVSLSSDQTPCPPARYHGTDAHTGAVGADTVPAATPWKTPRKPEWKYFEYPEDNTYDFSSYGEEDYRRDRYGDKALVHIFGDDEAKSAANQAVLDYKVDQIQAQRAAVHSDNDNCQPYDPCPSCLVPDPPDDDSFGQHTYGYNALVYIYGDKAAARAGCMGAMDHKEKQRLALIAADGYSYLDDVEDSGPDPPERPPPKPRVLAYFGPPDR